jgi:hypothetical protein
MLRCQEYHSEHRPDHVLGKKNYRKTEVTALKYTE